MRLDSATDERSDLQPRQFRYGVDRNAGTFMQINVTRPVVANGVEQRNQPPIAFAVQDVGKEHRVPDHQSGLFHHFTVQRFLNRFTRLDGATEPGPTIRMSNSGLVVTVMKEQSVAGDDEQHRGPASTRICRFRRVRHVAQA